MGASVDDLKDVYTKQVRSVLGLAVPAWQAAITQAERHDIERVQKTALHIMLGDSYKNYGDALGLVGLDTLEWRRQKLCLKFAKKSAKDPKQKTGSRNAMASPTQDNNRISTVQSTPTMTDTIRAQSAT